MSATSGRGAAGRARPRGRWIWILASGGWRRSAARAWSSERRREWRRRGGPGGARGAGAKERVEAAPWEARPSRRRAWSRSGGGEWRPPWEARRARRSAWSRSGSRRRKWRGDEARERGRRGGGG